MYVVIDAYNVLRFRSGGAFVSEQEREAFIAQMVRYAQKRHHTLCVVFDGGPSRTRCSYMYKDVEVVYAGFQRTADAYMCDCIDCVKHTATTVVVTTDRAICAHAHRRDIVTVDAEAFDEAVYRALHPSETTHVSKKCTGGGVKTKSEPSPADNLLRSDTSKVPHKSEDQLVEPQRRRKVRHVSPRERRRNAVLDAL